LLITFGRSRRELQSFVNRDGNVARDGLHRGVRVGRNGEPVVGKPVSRLLFALLEVLQNPVLPLYGVGGALVISLLELPSLPVFCGVDRKNGADASEGRAARRPKDRRGGILRCFRADKRSRSSPHRGAAHRVKRVGHAASGEKRAACCGRHHIECSFPRGRPHAATGVDVSLKIPRMMS
jgi:hypothetical protein